MGRLSAMSPRIGTSRARLADRPKTADAFYQSAAWRDFASTIKAQRGWQCEDCGRDCTEDRRSLIADHVIERRDGGADFDPLNIRLLCGACHMRKTNRAASRRRAGA